jgi:arylformamidase
MSLLEGYRLIDLSPELHPGKESRRLEIRPFIYEGDNTIMHDVDMMSHVGVHVEAPSHYKEELPDAAALPLGTFVGEACVLDYDKAGPGGRVTEEVMRELAGDILKPNDILLLRSKLPKADSPKTTGEAARWLADMPIKMFGIGENCSLEADDDLAVHDALLRKNIPLIERLVNMESLPDRFLFIGFPLRIVGLDSSPIRAVALVRG